MARPGKKVDRSIRAGVPAAKMRNPIIVDLKHGTDCVKSLDIVKYLIRESRITSHDDSGLRVVAFKCLNV